MKREYNTMKSIPRPKPPSTAENVKVDDLIKNKTNHENLEDLIVIYLI